MFIKETAQFIVYSVNYFQFYLQPWVQLRACSNKSSASEASGERMLRKRCAVMSKTANKKEEETNLMR